MGYNYGAGNLARCRSVLWRLIGCETVLGVLSLALVELFPRQLIGIFGAEDALYNQFAVLTFRVYLCMMTVPKMIAEWSSVGNDTMKPRKPLILKPPCASGTSPDS